MTIAVSSAGPSLDAAVDPRFGRCEFLIIIELDSMSFEAVPNTSNTLEAGAGIEAARVLINRAVETVLTGYIGPKAERVLSSAGLNVITAVSGTISDIARQYKEGKIKPMRKRRIQSNLDPQDNKPLSRGERSLQASLPGLGMGRGMGEGHGGVRGYRSRGWTYGFVRGRYCVCPNCGERLPHDVDKACFQKKCPKCGTPMVIEHVI